MIVTRAKLMSGDWRRVDLVNRLLPAMLQNFLADGEASLLLVAEKRSKSFKTMLAGLQNLRAAGLAE